jgi:hypothetical protein
LYELKWTIATLLMLTDGPIDRPNVGLLTCGCGWGSPHTTKSNKGNPIESPDLVSQP